MFKRFLSAYSAANDARPFVTKCVTAGALMAVGDMLCQSIEKKIDYNENKKDAGYDWARLRHFGFYGLILNGPMLYATYQHILPAIAPGTSGMQLFKKIMFTQTALTLTSVTAFYICLPLIQGQGVSEGIEEIRHKMWPTLCTNWKVWPILQYINFAFVPVKFQAVYVMGFSIFWNCYLSFMKFMYKCPTLEDELTNHGETELVPDMFGGGGSYAVFTGDYKARTLSRAENAANLAKAKAQLAKQKLAESKNTALLKKAEVKQKKDEVKQLAVEKKEQVKAKVAEKKQEAVKKVVSQRHEVRQKAVVSTSSLQSQIILKKNEIQQKLAENLEISSKKTQEAQGVKPDAPASPVPYCEEST